MTDHPSTRRPSPLTLWSIAASLLLGAGAVPAQSILSDSGPKGASLCKPDEHTLCLDQGRFAITATFQQTPTGPSIDAHAVPVTDQTGDFWFFDPNNIELVVKVLNGCVGFDSFWFFAAGLTNVGVDIHVQDLQSGTMKRYSNSFGAAFMPIQDTGAFHSCP